MPQQEKEELCVGERPHDFDDVPESFFTVGWWKKPNPFHESGQWREDTIGVLRTWKPIEQDTLSGQFAGAHNPGSSSEAEDYNNINTRKGPQTNDSK